MDDNQKWLEAAAAIEQDIHYLKAAMSDGKRNGVPSGLDREILHLKVVLGVYRTNAASGIAFPNPDDLFCISNVPYGARRATTATRRDFKTAAF
ncbi:MAG TPA: hypothetical protein VE604_10610 [Candidatus Polarisedimenticolia bacterium]|jgi:hypothetical protein|nr:hypothetical protein [Candidatus Polarisedimenticolia bacterium]